MFSMIRCLATRFRVDLAVCLVAAGLAVSPASAQTATTPAKPQAAKPQTAKPAAGTAAKPKAAASAAAAPSAPVQVASFQDWGVYTSETAKGKVCYALAQPKERLPKTLNRDPGYIFVSSRPSEGVRNEVSLVLGFAAKDGGEGTALVGPTGFALVTKGNAAWMKNAAEDATFVDALRKGQGLVVKVTSKRGNESTDRYSLSGAAQALDRVKKECP
jgi:hypothetical protein